MRQIRFPGESPEHRRARMLRDRVDHLRDARQRIIDAADAERRRIERDLHDGAQQRMVAVAVTLGLAEARMESDPASAAKLVTQAREEAQLAVKELRELARGIHPALLSERGLGVALDALAKRAPVPVEVSGVPDTPICSAVEAAAYYVTAEALTNVAKYAHASKAWVQLCVEGDRLRVEVRDDGVGGADPSTGTGLRGLRDRVDALDGQFEVDSPAGGGTTVTVELPLDERRGGQLAATERTGGRRVATSNQPAPASPDPKTSPDVAPK
jgi:signal transduction histidine kinase